MLSIYVHTVTRVTKRYNTLKTKKHTQLSFQMIVYAFYHAMGRKSPRSAAK